MTDRRRSIADTVLMTLPLGAVIALVGMCYGCRSYLQSFKPDPPPIDLSEIRKCIDVPCAIQWGDKIVIPSNVAGGNLLCFQREMGTAPTCAEVGVVRSWLFAQRKS